jgi:hypothetical protein
MAMADDEVVRFARAIGAVSWRPVNPIERQRFYRANYFRILSTILIIKISRIKPPKHQFWGVGVRHIEIIERHGPYYLVLLDSTGEQGWFLSNHEIAHYIEEYRSGRNPLCWSKGAGEDDDWKAYTPLPDTSQFKSPEDLLRKINVSH